MALSLAFSWRFTGAAYCWENGWDGQLGNGSNIDISLVPTPVAGGLTFTAISAGADHTCGLSPAGAAYCWGHGGHGRLGTGDTAYHLVPEPVAGGFTFTDITAGADHTCGLTPAGAAYCWGNGEYGQLGNGDTENRLVPTPVAAP